MPNSTTLMLLSYNEKPALEKLLPVLPLHLFDRVLAIDGGSTDDTPDTYAAHGSPYRVQTVRGRGNAFRLASDVVETERVVFLSTDGNENPADLPAIWRSLRAAVGWSQPRSSAIR